MKNKDRLRRGTKVKVELEGIIINSIDSDAPGYRISVKSPDTGSRYAWWAIVPATAVKELPSS